MIDVEQIKNILEQLKAIGQKRISLSDLAFYTHIPYQQLKNQLAILNNYFLVEKSGRAVYISLK